MDAAVLTSVLAVAGTALGSLSGVVVSARLVNYRLEQLEKKVEKHNNLVERMARVEAALSCEE